MYSVCCGNEGGDGRYKEIGWTEPRSNHAVFEGLVFSIASHIIQLYSLTYVGKK